MTVLNSSILNRFTVENPGSNVRELENEAAVVYPTPAINQLSIATESKISKVQLDAGVVNTTFIKE